MNSSELTKKEVLSLLKIYKNWMREPDPSYNRPDEFKHRHDNKSGHLKIILGILFHLYLWSLAKIGSIFGLPPLLVWASKMSIKFDHLWYEPLACGYTNACSDMGVGYLKIGNPSGVTTIRSVLPGLIVVVKCEVRKNYRLVLIDFVNPKIIGAINPADLLFSGDLSS